MKTASKLCIAIAICLLACLPATAQTPVAPCQGCVAEEPAMPVQSFSDSGVQVRSFHLWNGSKSAAPVLYDEKGKEISPSEVTAAVNAIRNQPGAFVSVQILTEKPVLHRAYAGKGKRKPACDFVVWIGCYRFQIRWETGPVGTCFKLAGVQSHLNIEFKNSCTNRIYFNVHAKYYVLNGTKTLTLYITPYDKCYRVSFSWDNIDNIMYSAIVLVGLGTVAAATLAPPVATVIFPLLAL